MYNCMHAPTQGNMSFEHHGVRIGTSSYCDATSRTLLSPAAHLISLLHFLHSGLLLQHMPFFL